VTRRPRSAAAAGRRAGRTAAVLAAAACLLSVTAGAAAASSPAPSPSSSDASGKVVYRVGVLEYIDSLNPFVGYTGVDYSVYHLNYDFLVGFEPQKLQPRPEYAESWSSSPDGLTWTFKIRPGMTWQDGEPATARDAAFTFNYILDNELSAFTGYLTFVKKVTAPDGATLVIELSKPKADILQMKVPMLPEHIWSKVSPKAAETSFKNGPVTIGSGPYQVVENKHNSYCRLVPNQSYWGGPPKVDELYFESYQNADTMVQDLKAGTLDAATGVPAAQFAGLASDTVTTNAAVSWSFEQLTFNCYDDPHSGGNPVLLDPQFRQALQWAVDREKNAAVAYSGYMSPGTTLLPPYSAYAWQPPEGEAYTYDPERANQELDSAGYKDVDGDGYRETKAGKPLSLRLYTDSQTPPNVSTSKLVVGWFKDVGVRTRLQIMDPGALNDTEVNYDGDDFAPSFDMVVWWWQGDAESPQFILSLLTSGQVEGWSDSSWTDPEYDRLFEQQATATDHAQQVALVQQMQQIVYEASPYLVFGYPQALEAYDTADWTGYVKVPGGYPDYNGEALGYDTYVGLRPVAAETAAASESGSSAWVWAVVAVAAAIAIVAVVLLLRRRGPEVEA
jgi:peptide/nickel transport system substrate-binding protein